jgi:diacylglycerol kinase (ATP)
MSAHASSLVLLNPQAGRGRAVALLPLLHEAVNRFPGASLAVTASPDEAADHVAMLPPASRVVVVGGDGSVNRLLPLLRAGGHILGLVPAGSGDDGARALGLRGWPAARALDHALHAPASGVDLGEARSEQGSRLFLSSLCAGFDAATAERAARMPRGLGGLRYLAATLAEIARLRLHEVDIEVDGRPLSSGPHLFVSSLNTATYGAGMPVVPAARIDDGQLDLLCAGRFGRAGALAMLPRLLLGRHLGHPRVQTRRFRQLHLRAARPLPLAADGEPMAAVSELRVVVLHGALRVVRA